MLRITDYFMFRNFCMGHRPSWGEVICLAHDYLDMGQLVMMNRNRSTTSVLRDTSYRKDLHYLGEIENRRYMRCTENG
jgi:hypothetical protein